MTERESDKLLSWGLGLGAAALVVWGIAKVNANEPKGVSLKTRIDDLVRYLNSSKFRKGWGGIALSVLKHELRLFIPAPLMFFMDAVYDAESRYVSGEDKLNHAIALHM